MNKLPLIVLEEIAYWVHLGLQQQVIEEYKRRFFILGELSRSDQYFINKNLIVPRNNDSLVDLTLTARGTVTGVKKAYNYRLPGSQQAVNYLIRQSKIPLPNNYWSYKLPKDKYCFLGDIPYHCKKTTFKANECKIIDNDLYVPRSNSDRLKIIDGILYERMPEDYKILEDKQVYRCNKV